MARTTTVRRVGTLIAFSMLTLAAAGAAAQTPVAAGKVAFNQDCAMCHNANSTASKIGPGLKGLFHRKALANGKPVTVANVREQIEDGTPNGKPMPMPAFKDRLNQKQLAAVVAYLRTL